MTHPHSPPHATMAEQPDGRLMHPLPPEAFAKLVATHQPRVLRFAAAFLGDRHLAEDVVQEAFGRLFEHRSRYPLEDLFGPYLVKTVARLCIDQRRVRQAEDRRVRRVEPRSVSSPAATVADREMDDIVAIAVGQLPDRERACFLLTVCEGFSYRDAAETLSLSYAEVNNAIHRARTLLRASLASIMEGKR